MEQFDAIQREELIVPLAAPSSEIVGALLHNRRNVSYAEIASDAGHDSFLLDDSHYHGVLSAYFDRIEV